MPKSNDRKSKNSKRKAGSELLPGEKYCGEKYRFSTNGSVSWRGPMGEIRIYAESGFDEILESMKEVGKTNGSFKILPGGIVATKKMEDDSAVFVCKLKSALEFDDPRGEIQMDPKGLEVGSLWTGFYDGCRSSIVWNSSSNKPRVWWKAPYKYVEGSMIGEPRSWPWKKEMPTEISESILRLKPDGGSFRVTSRGHVITLVEADTSRFADRAWEFDNMSDIQQSLVLMYMRQYLDESSALKDNPMSMLPIYVGSLPKKMLPLRFSEPKSYVETLDGGAREAIIKFLSMPSKEKDTSLLKQEEESFHNSPDMDEETKEEGF